MWIMFFLNYMATLFKASFYLRFIHLHIFPVLTSVIVTVECLTTWLLVVYFTPALKHMIRKFRFDYWRFSTVRFSTAHFWGVFHWVQYLVLFLVPPRLRFQASRTVTKTWRVNSADHWLAGKSSLPSFTFSHLADAFIQSDLQLRNTINW